MGKVDQNFEAGAHGECADAGSLQQNPCTVLGKVETAVTATCWEGFKPYRSSLRTYGSGMGAPSCLWDAWFLRRGVLTDGSKSVRRVHTRERERDKKAGFIMSTDSGVR